MRPEAAIPSALTPGSGDVPVFSEPWQAQAFAMAVLLHQRGLYRWSEWADALARQIAAAQAAGDPDLGDTYWQHWLLALERLVAEKGAGSTAELARYRQAWDRAAHRTPHGRPIELEAGDFGASSGTGGTL
ncbi:MAG: nitrile hydratase accessory protein [Burkholderiaceae bacterium]